MKAQIIPLNQQQTGEIIIRHDAAALYVQRKLGIFPEATTEGFRFQTNLSTEQALDGYAESQIKKDYQAFKRLRSERLRIKFHYEKGSE